jgi:hypothetical protein
MKVKSKSNPIAKFDRKHGQKPGDGAKAGVAAAVGFVALGGPIGAVAGGATVYGTLRAYRKVKDLFS